RPSSRRSPGPTEASRPAPSGSVLRKRSVDLSIRSGVALSGSGSHSPDSTIGRSAPNLEGITHNFSSDPGILPNHRPRWVTTGRFSQVIGDVWRWQGPG